MKKKKAKIFFILVSSILHPSTTLYYCFGSMFIARSSPLTAHRAKARAKVRMYVPRPIAPAMEGTVGGVCPSKLAYPTSLIMYAYCTLEFGATITVLCMCDLFAGKTLRRLGAVASRALNQCAQAVCVVVILLPLSRYWRIPGP
jgi:hypothetical protein